MFEKLKSLFARKKETPEEIAARERQEVQDLIEARHKGTLRIQMGLDTIEFDNLGACLSDMMGKLSPDRQEAMISPDSMELYRRTVAGLQNELDNAELSTLDTHDIDEHILELVVYFQNALRRGNEKTSAWLLTQISDAIIYSRKPYHEASEDRKAAELLRRTEHLEHIAAIAEIQDLIDQMGDGVRSTDVQIARKKEAVAKSLADDEATMKEIPGAEEILSLFRDQGVVQNAADLQAIMNSKQRVINAKRELKRLRLIREKKVATQLQLNTSRESLVALDNLTEAQISDRLMDRISLIFEKSKGDIAAQEARDKAIAEIERTGDAIFATLEQSMIKKMDETLQSYDDLMHEEKKAAQSIKEEGAKLAEKKKEKNADTVTDSEVTLLTN